MALPRPARALADGDEVAGLRIVATPGHSPGHVCVLDAAGSTAVVGDAAHNVGGELGLIGPPFTQDPARAAASLARLAALGFERALFAHGPALETGAAGPSRRLGAQSPDVAAPKNRSSCSLVNWGTLGCARRSSRGDRTQRNRNCLAS